MEISEINNQFFLSLTHKHKKINEWRKILSNQQEKISYLLGVWLGDGCRTSGSFQVSIATTNVNFQNNLYRTIKEIVPTSKFRFRGGRTQVCSFTELYILQYFFQFLLKNKLVDNYIYENEKLFLAGFLDTDGSIYYGSQGKKYDRGVWKVEFYNFDLYKIELVKNALDKLIIPYYFYNQKNYTTKQKYFVKNSYTVKCGGVYGYVIGKLLFLYMKNEEKQEKLIKLFNWLENRISSYNLPILEVFSSINGEGISAGYPQLFIRVFGCNAFCTVCDTNYASNKREQKYLKENNKEGYKVISLDELCYLIKESPLNEVCLTGGEITLYKDKTACLIAYIRGLGKKVVLQTNGICYDPIIYGLSNVIALDLKTFTMCPTYPIEQVYKNIKFLKSKDEIKTLVSNEQDWEFAKKINQKIREIKCTHIIQPLDLVNYKESKIREQKYFEKTRWLVEKILKTELFNVRLSLQLHKLVWGFDKRKV
jgi:7-carboxy-7-deazaguanine synthase